MSAHLAGKSVAFTGEFAGMTRAQVTRVAQAAGATVTSGVNAKTDFLICGRAPGPKAANANAMGITMLSQPQFSRFIKNVDVNAPITAAPKAAAPSVAPGQFQYPAQYLAMMNKAPRGRRPATAAPAQTYAAPAQTYAAPAPVAPMAQPVFDNKAVTLPGKSLSFTGTLETATRAEAGAMAAQAGATVTSAITPQTDYLVCGATPGQVKVIAAQAAGVRSVTEGQFMKAAIPAVNAMPEVQTYAAPAQTYAAPAPVMATRGRKPRVAAPLMAAPAAPLMAAPAAPVATPMLEAPTTGAMPWETEVVGEVAAPAMAAPKVRAPRKVAAPTQAYAAPSPVAQMGAVSLAGQNVVFTGALQVNRIIAATMVSKAGGIPQATLTAKTNLLVCGANAGPKMAKAQAMGIRVITEAEFVGACHF